MKLVLTFLVAISIAACSRGGGENYLSVPPKAKAPASPTSGVDTAALILPLEVDIKVAETFVRLGYALDKSQRFQSTEFLTPRLQTVQARHLIQLVKSYNEFEGQKAADALAAFEGKVSGVEFGREGSPVIYIELPYWTHQREGTTPAGMGTHISDEENEKLVQELRNVFVGTLKADEFSVQRRRVRIWWD